jgi:hypothetical protein
MVIWRSPTDTLIVGYELGVEVGAGVGLTDARTIARSGASGAHVMPAE